MKCTWCSNQLKLVNGFSQINPRYICNNRRCVNKTLLVFINNDDLIRYFFTYSLPEIFFLTGDAVCNETKINDNCYNNIIKIPFVKFSLKNYFSESNNLVKRLLKLKAFC